jgi:ring-1,2-phenylacetyl-CoA epoxidase subunit PaaC
MQDAIDDAWMFTGELFEMDDVEHAMLASGVGVDRAALLAQWQSVIVDVLRQATLAKPRDGWMISGGRKGIHTEHLGHMLAQMQFLPRAYPGAQW